MTFGNSINFAKETNFLRFFFFFLLRLFVICVFVLRSFYGIFLVNSYFQMIG